MALPLFYTKFDILIISVEKYVYHLGGNFFLSLQKIAPLITQKETSPSTGEWTKIQFQHI